MRSRHALGELRLNHGSEGDFVCDVELVPAGLIYGRYEGPRSFTEGIELLDVVAVSIIQFPLVEESSHAQKRCSHVVDTISQKSVRAKKGGDAEVTIPETGIDRNVGLIRDDIWGRRLGEGVWLHRADRRRLAGGTWVCESHGGGLNGLRSLSGGFVDVHVVLHGDSLHIIHIKQVRGGC